jgi:hypothetical protein
MATISGASAEYERLRRAGLYPLISASRSLADTYKLAAEAALVVGEEILSAVALRGILAGAAAATVADIGILSSYSIDAAAATATLDCRAGAGFTGSGNLSHSNWAESYHICHGIFSSCGETMSIMDFPGEPDVT